MHVAVFRRCCRRRTPAPTRGAPAMGHARFDKMGRRASMGQTAVAWSEADCTPTWSDSKIGGPRWAPPSISFSPGPFPSPSLFLFLPILDLWCPPWSSRQWRSCSVGWRSCSRRMHMAARRKGGRGERVMGGCARRRRRTWLAGYQDDTDASHVRYHACSRSISRSRNSRCSYFWAFFVLGNWLWFVAWTCVRHPRCLLEQCIWLFSLAYAE